jgi:2'-phosphotransferase
MDRQHIHLAPAVENHRITPRPSSRLYIYLDLGKVLAAGIKVYTSANGVVLSPGDDDGRIQKELWSKVERKVRGERVLIWQDGKDVFPDESSPKSAAEGGLEVETQP